MTQRYYSHIYWHFTGSPKEIDWSKVREPSDILLNGSIQNSLEATEILKKILKTRKLLATAIEKISSTSNTKQFCCVTDIPFKDLPEHTRYYGMAAIGFRAKAIHKSFLPVLYIPLENLPVMKLLEAPIAPTVPTFTHESLKLELGLFDYDLQLSASELDRLPKKMMYDYRKRLDEHAQQMEKYNKNIRYNKYLEYIKNNKYLKFLIRNSDDEIEKGYLKNYLKITNFSTSSSQTFYREREWRCLKGFEFNIEDVAALIVEEKFLPELSSFVNNELESSKNISCLSWEGC